MTIDVNCPIVSSMSLGKKYVSNSGDVVEIVSVRRGSFDIKGMTIKKTITVEDMKKFKFQYKPMIISEKLHD